MALLSRKVDYALMILSYLHHRPEGGCARLIAERFDLKPAFAANVLKVMCRSGLVSSQRGIRGGYTLARKGDEIALSDVLDAVGETFHLADCNRDEGGCSLEGVCPVRSVIAEVHARIRAVLDEVTLAELCRERGGESCTLYGLEVGLIEHLAAK